MGTRCLTFVYDGVDPIINMYRQYDGYPEGHGAELAEFLSNVEGNGIGDVAAQLVAHFKTGPYGFYLYPASAIDCGQDYEYHIEETPKGYNIRVVYCGCNFFGMTQSEIKETIFDGLLSEFVEFCKIKEEA